MRSEAPGAIGGRVGMVLEAPELDEREKVLSRNRLNRTTYPDASK